ncbi:MAG TPA: NAD-dependent epimerase/dehydratase family protein, partial [Actinomycetota bacterium]|nr:NAD-dependent epimerase/dehydratase family protein [Actinomycetota bacterium]
MSGFDWKGTGVFVTGATGFVGGWLATRLVELGARVVALVRDVDPLAMKVHPQLWDSAVQVSGDVTDLAAVRRALAEHGVTVCFHLAAQAAVRSALADPSGTFESNVKGTWTVLEACRQVSSIDRIVMASSDKAYGDQPELPYVEDVSPLAGKFPYDASKAAGDIITNSYFHTFELPVAITRNANTYGGGDLSGHRLVPETVMAILGGRPPVIRSDGSPERDYLHVSDAVAGYIALAEQLGRPEIRGQAFNLGAGVAVSVIDL